MKLPRARPADIPTAATTFPREIVNALRPWGEHDLRNLIFWHEADGGAHFAAFEQPALFVDEMRAAFRALH